MKILVTGGSSTIGKHLQILLPEAMYLSSQDCDLTDFNQTQKIIQSIQPDWIIHLAALVGGIEDNIQRPVEYLEQNILINTNVIKAAYQANVQKMIAMSSTCVYPDKVESYPMKEEDMFSGPPTPTNFNYAYSKRCMIAHIESCNKQFGTRYCYITPSNLYSELDTHKQHRSHYITALLDKIHEQELKGSTTINLLGTGKPLRQFTYAEDIARIITLMIKQDIQESFNVSTPEVFTIDELARITLQSLDKKDWTITYSNPLMDGQYRKDVSIEKFQNIFPQFQFTKFAEGIKRVYIKRY
jgi:GDP-L-fucose synthase